MKLKQFARLVTMFFIVATVFCTQVLALSARHAIVMDAQTGKVLFSQDADTRCLIASTTKIMTGLLICEDCELSREFCVPPEAQGVEGSSIYLRAGERLRLEELLYGMMLQSGNDAATALAIAHSGSVEAFAACMNRRAKELGLKNTHFANPHGLDDEGNYSTAEDLAHLAAAAMENETFARVVSTKQYRFGERMVTNHNKLLWRYEGAEGIKTGFTKAAGRILVSSARRQGRRLICVTINAPDDWNDHCALFDEAYRQFECRPLCQKGQIFGAEVSLEGKLSGYLVASQDLDALLLPEEKVDRVRIDGESVTFFSNERAIGVCPLSPIEIGEHNGGADSENHICPRDDLPAEGRGVDGSRSGAGQR